MRNLGLSQKSSLDPSQVLSGVHVLLVEDEPDIADLLVLILERAGAEVTALTDAETALARLESLRPNILLCNVKLPLQHGGWLIEQIRMHACSNLRQLPAIALTSYTRDVSKSAALNAGFNRFLVKFEDSVVDEIVYLLSMYS
jgi:CheY-like chemotaxis protein